MKMTPFDIYHNRFFSSTHTCTTSSSHGLRQNLTYRKGLKQNIPSPKIYAQKTQLFATSWCSNRNTPCVEYIVSLRQRLRQVAEGKQTSHNAHVFLSLHVIWYAQTKQQTTHEQIQLGNISFAYITCLFVDLELSWVGRIDTVRCCGYLIKRNSNRLATENCLT